MAATPKKVIDLRALQNEIAGKIELNEGTFDVRRLNVGQFQTAMAIDLLSDPSAALEASITLVAEVVPGLPLETVRRLPPDAIAAILAVARQDIEEVEKLFPNATGPETPSTSPG